MKSRHADDFNHDPWAARYDRDVTDESNPIRAGYEAVLACVAASAAIGPKDVVIELGAGTGNLTMRLAPCAELTCVDVSEKMWALAQPKLGGHRVTFVRADLLGFFEGRAERSADVVVSTYAVHHLTQGEKEQLFTQLARTLRPGARVVMGDLMVADAAAQLALQARYRAAGKPEVAADMDEEFFWDIARCDAALRALAFEVEWRQFSELSWVVRATRRS